MAYFDHNGDSITKSEWHTRQNDPAYCTIKSYENEDVRVEVVWHGYVTNHNNIPREHWGLFNLDVYNVITQENGARKYAKDPIYSKEVSHKYTAIMEWEQFLDQHTECERSINSRGARGNLIIKGEVSKDIVADEHDGEMESEDHVSVATFETNPDAGSW